VSPTVADPHIPIRVAQLPDPEGYTWHEIASDLKEPVGLASPLDGSGHIFVLLREGLILAIQNGKVLPQPFFDLRDRVSTQGATTRGLLGLAFHPRFAQNGVFFVDYTAATGESVIARVHTVQDHSSGDLATAEILLNVKPPVGEHNGGDLAFGPDGFLYIALGDGGGPGYNDQAGNAQNTQTLLGSLLRLDVDGGSPYRIPQGNPFAQSGGRPEIWAYGLRNPWRFTFDSKTGDLYLADVGENRWEEIDFLPAGSQGGANFGWNYREGMHRFQGTPPNSPAFVDPVLEYDHSQGCAVTGGKVYRGKALPEWSGVYIYGDFCSGKVWGLLRQPGGAWQNGLLFQLQAYIAAFGQDEAGEVYLVNYAGTILKLSRK
jgi:glucose/arabinose dehydrogenase